MREAGVFFCAEKGAGAFLAAGHTSLSTTLEVIRSHKAVEGREVQVFL